MKLSFSTRGWTDLSWDEIVSSACEMHFSGIEAYNVPRTPALTQPGGAFNKYSLGATTRVLKKNHLSIPCFDSSNDLSQVSEEMLSPSTFHVTL